MNRLIHEDPCDPRSPLVPAPVASAATWWSTLGAIAGRALSDGEADQADMLAEKGYSLRHVSECLFGDETARRFFE